MTAETGDDPLGKLLVEGYGEEIATLLKYRRLATSLERLYGSKELLTILEDEEAHARFFVELTRNLEYDIAEVGERALLRELRAMAENELRLAAKYEQAIGEEKMRDEHAVAILRRMMLDSRRHHRILVEMSRNLGSMFSEGRKGRVAGASKPLSRA